MIHVISEWIRCLNTFFYIYDFDEDYKVKTNCVSIENDSTTIQNSLALPFKVEIPISCD